MGETIIIEGLKELRAQLRAVDKKLPREIRRAGNEAARIVVAAAKPKVPVGTGRVMIRDPRTGRFLGMRGRSHNGGHAVSSIKPASTQSGAGVSEGGSRFPYMPWLDFGGTINRHTGHPTHREFRKKGRFIWLAFAEHRQQVLDKYQDALTDAVRGAGLKVD